MSVPLAEPLGFFHAVQGAVRRSAGRALSAALKRWRNTRSADETSAELDDVTARFLIRYGVLDAGDEPPTRQAAYGGLLKAGARATGEGAGVLAAWLHAFAAGEYGWPGGAVCGDQPQCARCPLCEACRFLASGARPDRISGEALAETLARPEDERAMTPGVAELLAFLLFGSAKGAGAVARAEALLKSHGGLRGLLDAPGTPARLAGADAETRARLRALGGVLRAWSGEEAPHGKVFSSGRDFYEHYYLRLREVKKECFFVACLDQKNRLLGEEEVSVGTLTEALVHPREVLRPAIVWRAAAIAIAHNHPSGDPAPSRGDKAMTQRLREATELVGLRLLDHVVVGDGTYFSFAEKGLL